jgi:transketolase C-terminal domain/subunit
MRKTLARFLNKAKNDNIFFLHADMFPYRVHNEINPGVQESHLVNMAQGISDQNKTAIIYGVCGFILYKSIESIKLVLKRTNGSVILVNAGANGCYGNIGKGHTINDDQEFCDLLEMKLYEPATRSEFLRLIKNLSKTKGVHFVRLGFDNEKWK